MRTLALILAIFLPGCAGLNVQWVGTASFNSAAITTATMNPGEIVPAVTQTPAK